MSSSAAISEPELGSTKEVFKLKEYLIRVKQETDVYVEAETEELAFILASTEVYALSPDSIECIVVEEHPIEDEEEE